MEPQIDPQLQDFEERQLAEISPLAATSHQLRGVAQTIVIVSDADLKEANALKKDINAHAKKVKDTRLDLTRPLDAVTKQLIAREREILAPLEEGKSELSLKIIAYEEELEHQRRLEEKRIDGIVASVNELYRPGMTRSQVEKGRESAKALIADLSEADRAVPRVKLILMGLSNRFTERLQDIELDEQRAQKRKLDAEEAKLAAEKRELEAQKQRAEIAAAQLEADKAAAKAERDRPKSNIVEVTEFEIVSAGLVPRELCSPDDRKIREAIKAQPDFDFSAFGINVFKTKKAR